jgi:hypothetical protein
LIAAPGSFEMSAAAPTPLRPITQDSKIHHAPKRDNKRSRVAFEAEHGDVMPNTQRKLKFGEHPPQLDFVMVFCNMAINE